MEIFHGRNEGKSSGEIIDRNLYAIMKFNFFKDKNEPMKKKDHEQSTKVDKNMAEDLSADNVTFTEDSESVSAGADDQKIPVEELPATDEMTLLQEKNFELESANLALNDKYLRLSAEFDNYRKRTLRERMELTKTAAESVMLSILPVVDDFERAMHSIEQGMDFEATKEGIALIYNKFKEFNQQNGITEIDALGKDFDTDLHEALTKIPAPSPELKGKIVDVIQKGYYLNDKVIRFAKVVVGE